MLQIKTEKFQGPLNLLLKLIEKEKLDITEVNLAKIANQYIEYIKKLTKIDPDDLADFLVVA
ncbi:segregation/condensation protein A, partial [Patescibacteria group bacterium]|nr:segregation/condensation protein A [Patescibacteria group bacterium]